MQTITASLPIDAARRRATHWSQLMSAATVARIRMSLLRAYLRDLEAHAAGDTNRFDRMVGSRGETLASRDQWIASVRRFLADPLLAEHCPADLAQAKRRAVALAIMDAPGGEIDHE